MPRVVRILEAVSGLAGGGALLLGLGLLAVQLLGGSFVRGADGPGWTMVMSHLGVGLVAEILFAIRRRLATGARLAIAVGVILAVIALLVLLWWR